eukprot:scaffold588_cov247-Pinguiococcus_pyrenoidosus.AAC.9
MFGEARKAGYPWRGQLAKGLKARRGLLDFPAGPPRVYLGDVLHKVALPVPRYLGHLSGPGTRIGAKRPTAKGDADAARRASIV